MTDDENGPFGDRLDEPIAARLGQLVDRVGTQYGLSPREKQVLKGAATGTCSKTLALDLRCSPKTVEEYWRRIYVKFRLPDRREIVARLLWEALAGPGPVPKR
jgi:DNA-binding NarL/FixJ family response regulator